MRQSTILILVSAFFAIGGICNATTFYSEEVTCPLDGQVFNVISIGSTSSWGSDSDFYRIGPGGVLENAVWTCPRCNYSALQGDWEKPLDEEIKKRLHEALAPHRRKYFSYMEIPAEERYRYAEIVYTALEKPAAFMGMFYQRFGWTLRETLSTSTFIGDVRPVKEEEEYQRKALSAIETALRNNEYEKAQRPFMEYLAGELHRRLGNPVKALQWFKNVTVADVEDEEQRKNLSLFLTNQTLLVEAVGKKTDEILMLLDKTPEEEKNAYYQALIDRLPDMHIADEIAKRFPKEPKNIRIVIINKAASHAPHVIKLLKVAIADEDIDVAQAAIYAASSTTDPQFIPLFIEHASRNMRLAIPAIDALLKAESSQAKSFLIDYAKNPINFGGWQIVEQYPSVEFMPIYRERLSGTWTEDWLDKIYSAVAQLPAPEKQALVNSLLKVGGVAGVRALKIAHENKLQISARQMKVLRQDKDSDLRLAAQAFDAMTQKTAKASHAALSGISWGDWRPEYDVTVWWMLKVADTFSLKESVPLLRLLIHKKMGQPKVNMMMFMEEDSDFNAVLAMEILAKSDMQNQKVFFIESMVNSPARFRSKAAELLGQYGVSEAVPVMVEQLKDELPPVQESILRSLGNLGNAQHLPLIKGYLTDKNETVRLAARDAAFMIEKRETSDSP